MKRVLLLVVCVAILAMVPACKKMGCNKAEQAPQEIPTLPVATTPEMPAPEAPKPATEMPAPMPATEAAK